MHILFLPGAGGAPEFWHPLGALLPAAWKKTYLSWPGLGRKAHDPAVRGFADLLAITERQIDGPVALVAQSMGGIVAVQAALRHPQHVTHLVLVATSGGVDVSRLGGKDWRPDYLETFPDGARWIADERPDLGERIPAIACPTLLLWGGSDPISPVAVGHHLLSLIPGASLQVVTGGEHDLGCARAGEIAPLVIRHLQEDTAALPHVQP